MEQAVERLEMTTRAYRILEQMAQARSVTPSELVEDLVRQFQAMENISSLRQEYQRLADKALLRTITRREEKRMDAICRQIETLSLPQEGSVQEQRDQRADELIAKSETLLDLVQQQSSR